MPVSWGGRHRVEDLMRVQALRDTKEEEDLQVDNRSQPSPIRREKASPTVKFEFEEQIAINQSPQIVSDPSLDGYAVHKLGVIQFL
ncbi:hypothetical protein SOVF_042830 isoform A [Spinacia oleracea]|nr:hypothetical protein SOVF_042830 isoform A [Spinacia oleracea]